MINLRSDASARLAEEIILLGECRYGYAKPELALRAATFLGDQS